MDVELRDSAEEVNCVPQKPIKQWNPCHRATAITFIIIFILVIFLVLAAALFVLIWGVLGAFGFDSMFKTSPLISDSYGCYNYNRTERNPSNLDLLDTQCGYDSQNTYWKTLNVPASNWTYVNFTSRANGGFDSNMNLKGSFYVQFSN
jgi:hypothetical protein